MTRLIIALLMAFMVPALADDANDAFLSKKPDASRDRWKTVLLAECMGIENEEVRRLLASERMAGEVPPFDKLWCIKHNHATNAKILKDGWGS